MVDIVDGEILRDVKQKIVREGVERHEEENMMDGGKQKDGRRSKVAVVEEQDADRALEYGKCQRIHDCLICCGGTTPFLIWTIQRASADPSGSIQAYLAPI